jgi:hypothetical protein
VTSHAIDHASPSACPNCGADVSGNFCQHCGQETVLHPPSIGEFLHEFIGHYVALEGKLWHTLRLLLLKPGALTHEYLVGRRVRYIQPLRVYLTFSLIFFAVLKFTSNGNQDAHGAATGQAHTAPAAGAPAKAPDRGVEVIHEDNPGEFKKGTSDVRTQISGISPSLAEHFGRFVDLPAPERERLLRAGFYSYAPYAIFVMMPLFALYLKILYLGKGRRYGEHLLFALHTNAFAFLAMTLTILLPDGFGLIYFLLFVWLAFYLPVAMRRVYGGTRIVTGLRWIVLMFLHVVTIGLAIFAAVAFSVLH